MGLRSRGWTGLILLGAILALPGGAWAQAACGVAADIGGASARWQGPLVRQVTLYADDITLGEALDRLAAAAAIRFSYSADAVPLERRVCASYAAVPVGGALTQLLRGTGLEPVVAGADHVVLAPARVRAAPNESSTEPAVVPLEPVHVRVKSEDAPHGASAVHAVVIDGRQLAQRGSTTLAEVLNGAVPGVWIWHDGSGGTSAAYGSIRGASSFRAAAPKVYIDGIEVANPQLLTRISPAAVERIEIIRGPQGAALYGANALNGVVNIITRRDHAGGGSPVQYIQSGVGVTGSDFAGPATLSQDHAVGIVAGTERRSAGVNLSVGTLGEYAPGTAAQHIVADAFGRITGSRSVVTATLRFLGERSGTASSPLLPDSLQRVRPAFAAANALVGDLPSMRQYTAGISASFQPSTRWSHTVTAGVDGYRLAEPHATLPAIGAFGDNELAIAALRLTARASSLRSFHAGDVATGTITLAAEHSLLRQESVVQTTPLASVSRRGDGAGARPRPVLAASPGDGVVEQVSTSTGLTAQSQLLWYDRLLLTGGVRLERNGSPVYAGRWVALPTVGGALLARHGTADLRLRAAFGRAVRWPTAPLTTVWSPHRRHSAYVALAPEEQSGIEAGLDVSIGSVAALHVTRFDQAATGVEPAALAPAQQTRGTPAPRPQQSEATIENRGWELEASLSRGQLGIAGNLSFVDSRVRSLAAGYDGDLRPGDRMLAVPARTASLTASWTGADWSAAVTAMRATNWINYDRLALLTDGADPTAPTPPDLRAYWRRYDGFTHLSATAARQLGERFTLTFTGTNLLGLQLGEPDNITVLPGRSFSLGVRATF